MLAIKLQRIGRRHQPSYRVVVAGKRSKLGGPPVEDLGSYNPFTKIVSVRGERVAHWLRMGALPTPTVHNLLIRNGVLPGSTIPVKTKRKRAGEEAVQAAETKESPSAVPTP